jgi:hypothetical protein
LVTTPERAAATVGDLIENGAIGGACRFWIGAPDGLFAAVAGVL